LLLFDLHCETFLLVRIAFAFLVDGGHGVKLDFAFFFVEAFLLPVAYRDGALGVNH